MGYCAHALFDAHGGVMAEIYGLYHPETGELRYVGKANDSAKRLKSHLRDAKSRRTPLYSWIGSLSKRGLVPVVRVLEVVDNWQAKEKELIALHRASGARLLNVAEGGDEPFCATEVRRANSLKMQAHPNTIAQRKINGKKLNDPNRYIDPSYTHEMLIRDTYDWIEKLGVKSGMTRCVERVRDKKGERYRVAPEVFPQWAEHAGRPPVVPYGEDKRPISERFAA